MPTTINILTCIFPPVGRADGIYHANLANGLIREGFAVNVFCPDEYASAERDDALAEKLDARIGIVRLPFHSGIRDKIGYVIRAVPDLYWPWVRTVVDAARNRKIGPGILWISTPIYSNGIGGLRAASILGYPYVLDFRDDHRGLAGADVAAALAVFASTGMSARNMEREYGLAEGRIETICCGFGNAFDCGSEIVQPPFEFVYAGALNTRTDSGAMFEAFRRIARDNPALSEKLRLHVYAPETNLYRLAYSWRLPPNAKYHGYRPLDEVLERIGTCAAGIATAARRLDFCVPSKVFSYLGRGRPVIACGLPGGELERFVGENGLGLFAPQRNPGALAEKIELFVSDEALRRKLFANVRRTAPQFGFDAQIGRAAALIRRALADSDRTSLR